VKSFTYYDILTITTSATQEEIKSAFRKLSKKFHPDNNDGDESFFAEQFKQIHEAYEILSDPIKRKLYDQEIEEATNEDISHHFKSKDIEDDTEEDKEDESRYKIYLKRKKSRQIINITLLSLAGFCIFTSIFFLFFKEVKNTQANIGKITLAAKINTANGLNLRSMPSKSAKVLTVVPNNAFIEVINKKGEIENSNGTTTNWIKIAYNGNTGWIASGFLKDVDSISPYKIMEVSARKLNVREFPNEDSKIVTTLDNGASVSILSTNDKWSQIRTDNNKYGYVSIDFLSEPKGFLERFKNGFLSASIISLLVILAFKARKKDGRYTKSGGYRPIPVTIQMVMNAIVPAIIIGLIWGIIKGCSH